jgi:hypothetical protein
VRAENYPFGKPGLGPVRTKTTRSRRNLSGQKSRISGISGPSLQRDSQGSWCTKSSMCGTCVVDLRGDCLTKPFCFVCAFSLSMPSSMLLFGIAALLACTDFHLIPLLLNLDRMALVQLSTQLSQSRCSSPDPRQAHRTHAKQHSYHANCEPSRPETRVPH